MSDTLKVSIGQHSDKGCKEVNQDFHGACMPQGLALAAKGVVVALADGISSSDVSQIARCPHGNAPGVSTPARPICNPESDILNEWRANERHPESKHWPAL